MERSAGMSCLVMSFNLLNWGMYGRVADSKVARVKDIITASAPDLLCVSEIGPNDAVEQLTAPLSQVGLRYQIVSVGYPNQRGIRNVILGREGVEVIEPRLKVPMELEVPPVQKDTFQMGGMKLSLSREPLAVLVRARGYVLAVGFFHPKSKFMEDLIEDRPPSVVPNQTYLGLCKMMSSLRNFGQCLLARQWVDNFWQFNPLQTQWKVAAEDVHFVLVGDWNANPQEEQRRALQGYSDAGLPADTLLVDGIGSASTDLKDICTIPWGGNPNSFDAILMDNRLGQVAEARVIAVEVVDLFGMANADRDRVENEVLDHCPVGLYLK